MRKRSVQEHLKFQRINVMICNFFSKVSDEHDLRGLKHMHLSALHK